MCDGTHILHAVAFLLQRIIRCGSTLDKDLFCLDLKRLFCFRSRNQFAFYDHGCTNVDLGQLLEVLHGVMIYDLQGFKKSTVMQYQETEGLGITVASYPAANLDFLVQIFLSVSENFSNCNEFHFSFPILCLRLMPGSKVLLIPTSLYGLIVYSIAYSKDLCKGGSFFLGRFTLFS